MKGAPPRPQQAPSAEHKWALLHVPKRQAWIGMTEREFVILHDLVVLDHEDDWIMWYAGWPEWKPISDVEKFWTYELPPPDKSIPQPPSGGRA